uniref:Uncharacterized protein n=1 Tax=Populus trichocarpa TaxID=3694 RepID=A0A3N7F2Z8_POPTR
MSWFFSSSPKQKFVMFEEYGVNFPNLLYHTDKCIIIFPWGGSAAVSWETDILKRLCTMKWTKQGRTTFV